MAGGLDDLIVDGIALGPHGVELVDLKVLGHGGKESLGPHAVGAAGPREDDNVGTVDESSGHGFDCEYGW